MEPCYKICIILFVATRLIITKGQQSSKQTQEREDDEGMRGQLAPRDHGGVVALAGPSKATPAGPRISFEDSEEDAEVHNILTRLDRFYYCGAKSGNHCRSLCYAMGYPSHTCGRISCYCTF